MAKHYVYKFINIYNQVMYVGETNNINRRIREHLSCNPSRTSFRKSDLKYISRVEYLTLKSTTEGKLIEKYYILKYLSPVLKNKSIPSKKVKIKNPPDNWKIFMKMNKMCGTTTNFRNKMYKILINIIFWFILLYYIFK
ncbi:MAG: GIY-YIG nuclease family protein [Clostridium sp.]|nr:GIY-YIG nuclease family protein [Clostridium sp.]